MDIIAQGQETLLETQLEYVSQAITYTTGSNVYNTTAIVSSITNEEIDDVGVTFITKVTDFILKTSEILEHTPVRGDVIIYDGRYFELREMSGEGYYRHTDHSKKYIRVHTQESRDPNILGRSTVGKGVIG